MTSATPMAPWPSSSSATSVWLSSAPDDSKADAEAALKKLVEAGAKAEVK